MSQPNSEPSRRIETNGGAYIEGNVVVEKGDFVGRDKINIVLNYIQHPESIAFALWGFLKDHRLFFFIVIIVELILGGIYFHFQNQFLIDNWIWILAAISLILASWGWYSGGKMGETISKRIITLFTSITFIGLVGMQTWKIAFPPKFDPQTYGIAVAELGEGPDFRRTANARLISGLIYESLITDVFDTDDTGVNQEAGCSSTDTRSVEIQKIGVIQDSRTGQSFGKKINADILIWGQIITPRDEGTKIRFQLIEIPDRSVNPEYPIVLPVNTTATDIVSQEINFNRESEEIEKVVSRQSKIISSFARGLNCYLNQDYSKGLALLEDTNDALSENTSFEVASEGMSLILYYLGKTNHALGRIETGQDKLHASQDLNPKEPAIPMSLALGYRSLGKKEETQAALDTALQLLNDWLEVNQGDNSARYNRGIIYQMLGQPHDALIDYEEVTKRDPNFYIAHISLGQVAANLKRYEQAEGALHNAITLANNLGTNPSWAHLNLAIIYQSENKFDLAKTEYLEAIRHDPDVDWMYYFYAQFLESQQEMDASLETYQKMTEVSQNRGWAFGNLANFLRRRGLLEQALSYYLLAIHEQGDDALLHAYLAETYFQLGDHENALDHFEEAVMHGREIYYVYAVYAQALFQMGEYEQAAGMYEHALSLRPEDCAVLLNLGQIYQNLGKKEEAKTIYFNVIEICRNSLFNASEIATERLQSLD